MGWLLVFAYGGMHCDGASSVGGRGSILVESVWERVGDLGQEGQVQARAVRLLKDLIEFVAHKE